MVLDVLHAAKVHIVLSTHCVLRVEKQRTVLQEKLKEQQKQVQKSGDASTATSSSATQVVISGSGLNAVQLKAQLEEQLRKQRAAMQQKRLQDQQKGSGDSTGQGDAAGSGILQQKLLISKTNVREPALWLEMLSCNQNNTVKPQLIRLTENEYHCRINSTSQ